MHDIGGPHRVTKARPLNYGRVSSLCGVGLLVLAAMGQTRVVSAQSPPVEGIAVRVIADDTVAASGAMVTLHQVGETVQGAIDSQRVGSAGSFRFDPPPDGGGVLLVSARWHGVEYFAAPVVAGEAVTLVAIDTSSAAEVRVAARHVIIGGPAEDGTRDVIDLVVLRNPGDLTRSSATADVASWTFRLPGSVANLTIGDADFARDAFDAHGDTLFLHAPVPPGDRQFFLQYQLPPNTKQFAIPMIPTADTLSVLTEERSVELGGGLELVGDETVQGREFQRFAGGRSVGDEVVVQFLAARGAPDWLLPLLIVILVIPLGWATRRALLPRSER